MEIKQDSRTIKGEHKGHQFTLENGVLNFAGGYFDKKRVKVLLEIITLLNANNYELVEKIQERTQKGCSVHSWSNPFCPFCLSQADEYSNEGDIQ